MTHEEQMLHDAFTGYVIDNLFWSLMYLESAILGTPLMEGAKNKLLSMDQTNRAILTGIFPLNKSEELISAMQENNRLFVSYVEQLIQGGSQMAAVKQKWKQNGQRIAMLLSERNPYWKSAEWSAMIHHQTDLLETIAVNLRTRNYDTFFNVVPICRRLALDMANYINGGIPKAVTAADPLGHQST